jgi:2'-5' RNA ligase
MASAQHVIRAFIAINLSVEIQGKLTLVLHQLQEPRPQLAIRWVPLENIHLTLKFLGDVSTANLEHLKKILASEAGRVANFDIQVGELGAFPTVKRPRVVIVHVQAPDLLFGLQRGIDNETFRLGYAHEERPFTPHLTLGRVARSADNSDVIRIGQVVESTKTDLLGVMHIDQLHLFRSDLRPGGAVYTRLYSASLKNF